MKKHSCACLCSQCERQGEPFRHIWRSGTHLGVFTVQTVFQITKKFFLHHLRPRICLPDWLEWRKKVPGRMDMAMKNDRDMSVLHSHFLPTSLFWVTKCLPVPPCDCDPSITQGCGMPEHPFDLSQYPRSAASQFRFKAIDQKLRRKGRIGRGLVFYV